jgi:hypothetical protein
MSHSNTIGGSSAARALACPGSIPLNAAQPDDGGSAYAREGTALHEAMAALVEDSSLAISSVDGMVVDGVMVTADHIEEKIEPAFNLFDEFLDELEQIASAAAGEEVFAEFEVEAKIEFSGKLEGCYGTADVVGRAGNVGFILDWKFGSGVGVDVEGNKQLMFYAAAALESHKLLEGVSYVIGAIVQPVRADGGPELAWTEFTLEALEQFKDALEHALKLSERERPPLALGDHCRWCKAKLVCPLMNDNAQRALATRPGIDKLPEYLDMIPALEEWIKAVRETAHQTLESGVPVEGWKLVPKRATRKWADEQEVIRIFRRRRLLGKVMKTVLLSPTQIEKLKIELNPDLIISQSSGYTIAPDSDKREAAQTAAARLGRVAKTIQQ